jgi:hypothetical protein
VTIARLSPQQHRTLLSVLAYKIKKNGMLLYFIEPRNKSCGTNYQDRGAMSLMTHLQQILQMLEVEYHCSGMV